VRASGNRAREAVDHLLALAAEGFGEALPIELPAVEPAAAPATHAGPPPEVAAQGPLPASAGIGAGPARPVRPARPAAAMLDGPQDQRSDPDAQWRRLEEALTLVRGDVERVRARTAREVGEAEAEIFDAHLLLLQDSSLLDDARARIGAGQAAGAAWAGVVDAAEAEFAALPDAYLQARAADVRAVGDQVLRALAGPAIDRGAVDRAAEGVLVAGDLTPAEAAALDPGRVAAVVLGFGSPTAHSVILLRALGIPAVVAAGEGVLRITEGTMIAVDGGTGELAVDPDAEALESYRRRATEQSRRRSEALAGAHRPAVTRDGVHVLVGANAGSTDDARAAADCGADLLGLVRTEFLFLDRQHAPDVAEQEATYLAIAEAMGGRRVTLRTLDVGGDKPLRYLPMPVEANPFLGLRGIRLSLARPGLLAEQLLAIVRVAHVTPVNVMFPMVSTVDELRAARALLDEAVAADGRGAPSGMHVGAMVEVPAAALKSASLARLADFLSIGTNDLTQYALAAERGNAGLAALADPLDPGLLQLVAAVCRGAAGRALVAVCGELAADERAVALLIGLGVRELSVTPRAVPAVKEAVSAVDVAAAAVLAGRALEQPGPVEVRALLG
jgi:multiphosphoryl transfer protein